VNGHNQGFSVIEGARGNAKEIFSLCSLHIWPLAAELQVFINFLLTEKHSLGEKEVKDIAHPTNINNYLHNKGWVLVHILI